MNKYFETATEFKEWLNGDEEFRDKYDEVVVNDDVNLSNSDKLASLPVSLTVGGYLNICDTSLTSLPEGLKVKRSLYLHHCTSLASLPEGLEVGGYLDLYNCKSLTSLPERLVVEGVLDIEGCTSLTSLPEGMMVGEVKR